MVSTIPSAVSGLTKQDALSAEVTPSFMTKQAAAFTQRYCEYIEPPATPTVFPTRSSNSLLPALTTTPPPSLPTGRDWSNLVSNILKRPSGISIVTTAASPSPETDMEDTSAGPINSPKSEGFIGEASIFIRTSSSLGSGISVLSM